MIFIKWYKREKAKRTSTYYYPRTSTFNENSDLMVSITSKREGGEEERGRETRRRRKRRRRRRRREDISFFSVIIEITNWSTVAPELRQFLYLVLLSYYSQVNIKKMRTIKKKDQH